MSAQSIDRWQRIGAGLGALVCVGYLLNPTAGIFELIPDNIPVIGNLDEVAVAGLLFACWRRLRRPRDPNGNASGLASSNATPVQPPASFATKTPPEKTPEH